MSKIVIVGATGFLGKHLCEVIPQAIRINGRKDWNMLDVNPPAKIEDLLLNADYVLNCCGHNGGITFNLKNPADIFCINTIININLLEACKNLDVKKVISIVTSCAYPTKYSDLLEEKNYFDGEPHESVAAHGYAKRNVVLASRYYNQQYGCKFITVCPSTLFGEYDSFDPERTKVTASLIAKIVTAKKLNLPEVKLLGDGTPLRELIYVKDAVKNILLAAEKYEDSTIPLNIYGEEISIAALAGKICAIVDYKGKLVWTGVSQGQQRKRLCRKRQLEILGDIPLTPLDEGLRKTIDWYIGHGSIINSSYNS